jgi:pilus assembly protein Flp/PilA
LNVADEHLVKRNIKTVLGDTAMKNLFSRFANDESGATAIEYGLIAALVAVAIITALQTLGGSLNSTFASVSGAMTGAAPANP